MKTNTDKDQPLIYKNTYVVTFLARDRYGSELRVFAEDMANAASIAERYAHENNVKWDRMGIEPSKTPCCFVRSTLRDDAAAAKTDSETPRAADAEQVKDLLERVQRLNTAADRILARAASLIKLIQPAA